MSAWTNMVFRLTYIAAVVKCHNPDISTAFIENLLERLDHRRIPQSKLNPPGGRTFSRTLSKPTLEANPDNNIAPHQSKHTTNNIPVIKRNVFAIMLEIPFRSQDRHGSIMISMHNNCLLSYMKVVVNLNARNCAFSV